MENGAGVGKDVNDYLNHYVLVADGKAIALAAAAFALIGLAMSEQAATIDLLFRKMSIALAVASVVLSGAALYPRTPHSGNGHVFWADINTFDSAEAYWKSLSQLDEKGVGQEYAKQNFFVSSVLLTKNKIVQGTIWIWSLGCLLLAIGYWVR